MKEWLKDHIVPHEGNDHRPHFLRKEMALALVLVVFLFEALYLLQTFVVMPRSGYLAEVISSVLVVETNEKRLAKELGTLRTNALLEAAAKLKAEDMAAKGYFSHNTPDGKTPWYFLQEVGYPYQAAGENLAVNFTESRDVTEAWMNSPSHRANILSGKYTEIGIATARGQYKGANAVFVVQYFGKPKSFSPVALSVSTASTSVPSQVAKDEQRTEVLGTTSRSISDGGGSPRVTTVVATPTKITITESQTTEVAGVEIPEKISDMSGASLALHTAESYSSAPDSQGVVLPPAETSKARIWERVLASPRPVLTAIFAILGFIVLITLLLTIFVKIRIQHPHIIGNGLILLALLVSVAVLNIILGGAFGAVL